MQVNRYVNVQFRTHTYLNLRWNNTLGISTGCYLFVAIVYSNIKYWACLMKPELFSLDRWIRCLWLIPPQNGHHQDP